MYALEMIDITKTFGQVIADNRVTFRVSTGEIHALIGENGAGKTTLMNILYGMFQPDSGEIRLQDKSVIIHNPTEAIRLGIGMVHQHFMLVPSLTVIENIILGNVPTRLGFIDRRRAINKIEEINDQYDLVQNLNKKIYELSVGEMQRVEILKALYRGAKVFILDEPTAVLTPQQTIELFKIFKSLVQDGRTIIFITHKLKEVLAISDRITVMRNGVVTGEVETKSTSENTLARLMVGRDVVLKVDKTIAKVHEDVLTVRNLNANNNRGMPALKNLSFSLRRGEILGIAGVDGNGQTELVEVLTGLRKPTSGTIDYSGLDLHNMPIRKRRDHGVSHIPADRIHMGIEVSCTLEENLIINTYYKSPIAHGIFLSKKQVEEYSKELLLRSNVSAVSTRQMTSSLSGGNMQKLIVGREIEHQPNLLIASQPTRGVDVGAIEYIHKKLIKLRDQGSAILLISTELDEILSLSDRIIAIYEGEFCGEFCGGQVLEEKLGLAMLGAGR
ncbi:MAG: ABC transporter ATP-binding protein [Anaerolineaceae bacterium]